MKMKTLTLKDLIQYKGLWHSIKHQNIADIFANGFLEARTTHRYWRNGMVYRDNQGEVYENSHYMKGWSMTRDKDYAFGWGAVTFLFDWEALKRDFKMKTISWSYRGAYCNDNFDKEREEFVISDFMNQTIEEIKEEYFEIGDKIYDEQGREAFEKWRDENGSDYIEYWQRKGSRKIEFSKYLKGIFVCKESYDIYKGRDFDVVINHPLFKGFVSRKEAIERHDSSMKQKIYHTRKSA